MYFPTSLYALLRAGVLPDWEDPANLPGGDINADIGDRSEPRYLYATDGAVVVRPVAASLRAMPDRYRELGADYERRVLRENEVPDGGTARDVNVELTDITELAELHRVDGRARMHRHDEPPTHRRQAREAGRGHPV